VPWSWELGQVAARFGPPLRTQLRALTEAFEQLSNWLTKRTAQVEPLWWQTRGFPIVAMRDDNVTVWIESGQHRALRGLNPPLGALAGLEAGAHDFLRGFRRPAQAVEEATLLPNLFGLVNRLFGIIASTVTDFSVPRPDHFDPARRHVFDLFGQLALVGGTVLGATNTLMGIRNDVAEAQRHWQSAFPAQPAPVVPFPAAQRTLPESLDMGARYILGGILLLPQIAGYIELLVDAAGARLHQVVQDAFTGIVADFVTVRNELLSLVYAQLPPLLVNGLGTVFVAQDILLDNLWFGARFAVVYLGEVAGLVDAYLDGVRVYVNDWIDTIDTVLHVIFAVLDFDLVPVLLAFISPPAAVFDAYLAAHHVMPRFTIGDWLGTAAGVGRVAARIQLNVFLIELELAARGVSVAEWGADFALDTSVPYQIYHSIRYGHIRRGTKNYAADFAGRIAAVRRLVNIALASSGALPPVPTGGIALPVMPNLASTIFGPDRGRALISAILGTRTTVLREVHDVFGAARDLLVDLGGQAEQWSADAAQLGSLQQYRGIAADADALTRAILPDEPRRQQLSGTALADGFDQWLIHGGIRLAATAIPLYVHALADLWADHQDDVVPLDRETSPLILARRAKLARVHVPEVTVHAHGRALDDALLDATATELRGKIGEAYRQGKIRLTETVQAIAEREARERRATRRGAGARR
jgi:hypothetical protein